MNDQKQYYQSLVEPFYGSIFTLLSDRDLSSREEKRELKKRFCLKSIKDSEELNPEGFELDPHSMFYLDSKYGIVPVTDDFEFADIH